MVITGWGGGNLFLMVTESPKYTDLPQEYYQYPILDTRISVRPCVTLTVPPLDSETGWTGELWSKTNLLKWQN